MTVLVLDDEVQPDYRYLGPEIDRLAGDSEYLVAPESDSPFNNEITVDPTDYDGIIISGSTASVYEAQQEFVKRQQRLIRECINESIPLLGICFGHQLVNYALGGEVREDRRRATFVRMSVTDADDPVLSGVEPVVPVLHSDLVVELGDGLRSIATTDYNENFCTRHETAPIWTVQYHPEFTERVEENPSDWTRGDYDFTDSTATKTISNFVEVCHSKD
jgi:GMP synthase (glutamine-hydrolysing)